MMTAETSRLRQHRGHGAEDQKRQQQKFQSDHSSRSPSPIKWSGSMPSPVMTSIRAIR